GYGAFLLSFLILLGFLQHFAKVLVVPGVSLPGNPSAEEEKNGKDPTCPCKKPVPLSHRIYKDWTQAKTHRLPRFMHPRSLLVRAWGAARLEWGRDPNRRRVVPFPASDLNPLVGLAADRHNGSTPRPHLWWLTLPRRRSATHRAHARRDDRPAPRPGF